METPPEITTELRTDLVADAGGKGLKVKQTKVEKTPLTLGKGYMFRESNWEIGRAAEKAGIKVKEFKPRDRWEAWRKRTVRQAIAAEKRSLGGRKSKK